MIVQFGGQTPLRLAVPLQKAGVKLLGTSADAIDRAEDRQRFGELVRKLGLRSPAWGTAYSLAEARKIADDIGYPVMVRPSYVLGGRAMEIVHDASGLEHFVNQALEASRRESLAGGGGSGDESAPILVDQFLRDAVEVDVDVIADGTDVIIGGVMEHIEEAGIHSGDSACSLPPFSLAPATIAEIKDQARALARELDVRGLMNIQFAVPRDGRGVFILEVNPRASRTVPFVSKVSGVPLAKIAAKIAVGRTLADMGVKEVTPQHIAVKEAVFPFVKFPGVDTLLGPEMRSTGEVMGIDRTFDAAFAKSQIAASTKLPVPDASRRHTVFLSLQDSDKAGGGPGGQGPARPGLPGAGDQRHLRTPAQGRGGGGTGEQGPRGPSPLRRSHAGWGRPPGHQHHPGGRGHPRLVLDPAHGPDARPALFHHLVGGPRRGGGNWQAAGWRADRLLATGVPEWQMSNGFP